VAFDSFASQVVSVPHHAERLVNPKDLAKKRLLILDTPEHVDSEKLNRHDKSI
jgi:hypothetical protein